MPFAEMEARLVVAMVLQRYTPELVPDFPVVPIQLITLRPKYGLKMILKRQQSASLNVSEKVRARSQHGFHG